VAYGTPTNPVAGTVITVAYAVANLLEPIRQLRANTGGADPPAANRVAVSTAPGGPTSWQQVGTDVIANGAVTDVKLQVPKVGQKNPSYTSFAATAAEGSGFFDVSSTHPDGPVPGQNHQLIQARHTNWGVDYRIMLAATHNAPTDLYLRGLVNGVWSGSWQKLWHAGNHGPGSGLDADLLQGQTPAQIQAAASPSGLIAAFRTAAAIAAGWARFTDGDGRMLVGAGSSFEHSFSENSASGSTWAHTHGVGTYVNQQYVAVAVQSGTGGGGTASTHNHAIAGSSASATWTPVARVVVWAIKQ
jgi:hypothetical protein